MTEQADVDEEVFEYGEEEQEEEEQYEEPQQVEGEEEKGEEEEEPGFVDSDEELSEEEQLTRNRKLEEERLQKQKQEEDKLKREAELAAIAAKAKADAEQKAKTIAKQGSLFALFNNPIVSQELIDKTILIAELDAVTVKTLFATLQLQYDDIRLKFHPKTGMTFEQLDSAHVSYFDFKWFVEAFVFFHCKTTTRPIAVGLKTAEVQNILANVDKTANVRFILDSVDSLSLRISVVDHPEKKGSAFAYWTLQLPQRNNQPSVSN